MNSKAKQEKKKKKERILQIFLKTGFRKPCSINRAKVDTYHYGNDVDL